MTARPCGTCTLCCKVMAVGALDKPMGAWCTHCGPGKGCGIYPDRPPECRTFQCIWTFDERLGPEWKPEKSKIVLAWEKASNRVVAYIDPSTPSAWKRAPYFEALNEMMLSGLPRGRQVFISVAGHITMLLPGRQEELGLLTPDDEVELAMITRPAGTEYRVSVRKSQVQS